MMREERSRKLDAMLAGGVLAAIVFPALAHGVVEPWSMAVFQLLVAALVAIWALRGFVDRRTTLTIPVIAWPLIGLIAIGAAQSITWTDAAGFRRSLSFNAEATQNTTLTLACLLVCAVLAATCWTRRERLLPLAKFLTVFGMLLASFALVQNFSGTRSIYWLREVTTNVPFGPFVNRDHFAAYIELLLGVPVALIVTRVIPREQRFLYGGTAMVMGVAAIFTLSRGGMVSIFAELLFLGAVGLARSMRGRTGRERRGFRAVELAAVAAILAAILGGVVWIGADPVINRIATGNAEEFDLSKRQSFYQARGLLWVETWRVIRANPLLGTGLGAYETAYPAFSGDKGIDGIVAQAHNDYLQILADAGIPGGALALWFLLLLARATLRGVMRDDSLVSGMTLGCSAGAFGLLVHSLFDFGLQLPSHAVLFLVLAAIISRLGARETEPAVQRATFPDLDPALFGQGA